MQHARLSRTGERFRVVALGLAAASRLNADFLHRSVVLELVERADGVAAAADAGQQVIDAPAGLALCLRADLISDAGLEIAHDGRVRVRPYRRADDVMRVLDMGGPVTNRLAGRVFQRACAAGHGNDLRAEELHAEHVQLLPLDVRRSHEHMALHAKERRRRRRRDAVLARARLCDHALLAHSLRKHRLPQRVRNLVCAGVEQILALQIDFRLAVILGQPLRVVKHRRTTRVPFQITTHLRLEVLVVLVLLIGRLQLRQHRHHDLRHELPAVFSESSRCHDMNPPDYFSLYMIYQSLQKTRWKN